MPAEKNAYILGTDYAELNRLGFQHQVWSSEARKGWQAAGFSKGQKILDLGAGPGFCSVELAYMVGEEGEVVAVDKSQEYLNYLDRVSDLRQLNIKTIQADFKDLDLEGYQFDGIYHRWALAWTDGVQDILHKLYKSLKPGGRIVSHEYYDWKTLQVEPFKPNLSKAISAALKAWNDMDGNINIGRRLPNMLINAGFKVKASRLMPKLATPDDLSWHWPKSFFNIYFPKLAERNYLSEREVELALDDFNQLESTAGATLFCPILIEIIAEKGEK